MEVLKFDKYNSVSDSQPENILFIDVTDDVSKFERFSDIKLVQLQNILSMFLVRDVLKLVISIDFKE